MQTRHQVPDIDRHLVELLDREAVSMLVHRVGACLDDARFDDLRQLLAEDVVVRTPGGVSEGVDAVLAQASRNHDAEERIQHVITDVLVDVDGDRAEVRANLVVTFGRGALSNPPYFVMGEIYEFRARRDADGWRLTSIATRAIWRQGER
jgi:ketosteroid isomerase-like protein